MDIVKAIGWTIALIVVLHVVLIWSHNIVFMLAKRPVLWISLCFLIGVGAMLGCRLLGLGHSIAFWGGGIAFLLQLPPRANAESRAQISAAVDEVYREMGIHHGRLKYRLGLAAFVVGCAIGYVLAYGQLVTVSR
jgi:hypothetical protein